MTIEEIRELIKLVTDTGIAELEVQRGDNRVRIRRANGAGNGEPMLQSHVAPPSEPPSQPGPAAVPGESTADPSLTLVKSPIVGTFYESASPGSPPFVRIGETVQPGKVLCIIESMKLMNEIEAEVAGVLESKFVLNGQPVEYGEALFAIRPL